MPDPRSLNPLLNDPDTAYAMIRRERWDENERVTEDDALDLHRKRVCRDCGRKLGRPHIENCPQREESDEED